MSSEISLTPSQFPHQKRSQSEKNKKFFKECIDAGASMSAWGQDALGSSTIRNSRRNKIVNYNLLNNIISKEEMDRVVDPFKIQFEDTSLTYKNYPLVNPSINLLVGEERKRMFSPQFVLASSDAVNQKIKDIGDNFHEFAVEKITSGIQDEQLIQREVEEWNRWLEFSYKDKRERMANQTIQYLTGKLRLKEVFNRGFEDLLISTEEIYVIDIIGGEPILRKADPVNIYTLRGGHSYKIEDNDIIVEDGYLSPGEIVDRYYDYLTPADIKKIEGGTTYQSGAKGMMFKNQLTNELTAFDTIIETVGVGNLVTLSRSGASYFGGAFDSEGNVRVTRVVWKGFRKIGIKEYFDEVGDFQRDIVPEGYEPQTDLGEKIEWTWVTEWYEGTKIGADIYIKMQPREVQMRRMDNLSYCHPGIVGSSFNIDGNKAMSLVDLVRDYQYLYNFIMYKTENGIAKYLGKVGKINLSMIPEGWTMSKYLSYLYNMNMMVEDPFNEGNRGAATGKLAGSMSQQGNSAEFGDPEFIQRHIEILRFIEERVDQITGITNQRRGAIDNRETVGGVERSVMQSSHITEKWFSIHDDTRLRALECLLEAAKVAWNKKSFIRSYILDDGSEAILDFDSQIFNESEYGGYVTSDSDDRNILEQLKSLTQPMIQNGTPISVIVDMLRTKDIGSLHRKIAMAEADAQKRAQEAQQAGQEALQQEQQAAQELEMMKLDIQQMENELDRELEQYKIDRDNDTKITVAQINAYRYQESLDQDNDGIPDPIQIGDQAIKRLDVESKHYEKQQEIKAKEEESRKKKEVEEKKIKLEEKKMEFQLKLQKQKDAAALEREKLKSRTQLKNKVVGER
jgi:hypothetical protein